jgi:hypothetical protein
LILAPSRSRRSPFASGFFPREERPRGVLRGARIHPGRADLGRSGRQAAHNDPGPGETPSPGRSRRLPAARLVRSPLRGSSDGSAGSDGRPRRPEALPRLDRAGAPRAACLAEDNRGQRHGPRPRNPFAARHEADCISAKLRRTTAASVPARRPSLGDLPDEARCLAAAANDRPTRAGQEPSTDDRRWAVIRVQYNAFAHGRNRATALGARCARSVGRRAAAVAGGVARGGGGWSPSLVRASWSREPYRPRPL